MCTWMRLCLTLHVTALMKVIMNNMIQTKTQWVVYLTTCSQFFCLLATSPFSIHPKVWVIFCNQIVILYFCIRQYNITYKNEPSFCCLVNIVKVAAFKNSYPLWGLWPISDGNRCPGQKCRGNGCHEKSVGTFTSMCLLLKIIHQVCCICVYIFFWGSVNLTWNGYLKLHGMGTSLYTTSTHLILESSMQPLTMGFFWNIWFMLLLVWIWEKAPENCYNFNKKIYHVYWICAHLPPVDVQNTSGLGCPIQKTSPYS